MAGLPKELSNGIHLVGTPNRRQYTSPVGFRAGERLKQEKPTSS